MKNPPNSLTSNNGLTPIKEVINIIWLPPMENKEDIKMLHCYTPEMGQKEPTITVVKQKGHLAVIEQKSIEMELSIGHYGTYYIETKAELKGRGIKKIRDHYINIRNERIEKNTYTVTSLALEKLKQQYDIKKECLLD